MLKIGTRVLINKQVYSQTHMYELQKYFNKVAYITGQRRTRLDGPVWYKLDITGPAIEFSEDGLINIDKGL